MQKQFRTMALFKCWQYLSALFTQSQIFVVHFVNLNLLAGQGSVGRAICLSQFFFFFAPVTICILLYFITLHVLFCHSACGLHANRLTHVDVLLGRYVCIRHGQICVHTAWADMCAYGMGRYVCVRHGQICVHTAWADICAYGTGRYVCM